MLNRAVAGAMARFVTGYKLIGYKFVITCNFVKQFIKIFIETVFSGKIKSIKFENCIRNK